MRELVLALGNQEFRVLGDATGLVARRKTDAIVHGPAGKILAAALADGVEAFHRQSDRVKTLMAAGTRDILRVLSQQLAYALALGFRLLGWQYRHIGRRRGDVLAQQLVHGPEATLDRAGSRRLRVLGEEHRHAQHSATPLI